MIISKVQVGLESPDENATGMIRIESVTSYDENDNIIKHYNDDELINYEDDSVSGIINHVANYLNVSSDIIRTI